MFNTQKSSVGDKTLSLIVGSAEWDNDSDFFHLCNTHRIIPETIGQYTGLTDKNGKKIFEGDILRYGFIYDYNCYLESLEHPEEYDNEIYDQDIEVSEVKWCSDCDYPAFDLADHNFECNGLSQIMCGDYECEIIGNIHDNPELLKESDNDE